MLYKSESTGWVDAKYSKSRKTVECFHSKIKIIIIIINKENREIINFISSLLLYAQL